MKICVRDAFVSHSYSKEYSYVLSGSEISDFPCEATMDAMSVSVHVFSELGKVKCHIKLSADFTLACSRCAEKFVLPFLSDSVKEVKDRDSGDFEDVIITDGGMCFDLLEEIRAQLYFEFPAKPLCRKDCKGLCPVCGCDLNKGSCSCDIRTPDPRLAILKKLTDNN